MKKLFIIATSQTHFQFDGRFFDQIDGVAMGSPLAPALANLFMGHHENTWLISSEGKNVSFYKRYVDDIFCLVDNENEADNFLAFLNNRHENLKFTIEKEKQGKLPFLDVCIDNTNDNIKTSIFRKTTDTGLLTNFNSFTCFKYKTGLIKTLVDRIYKINNSNVGFQSDLKETKIILQKISFLVKSLIIK